MNANEPNLSDLSSWLEDLRKQEAESSVHISTMIEKYLKSAGLEYQSSGETKTWSSVAWNLYINTHNLLGDERYVEILKLMFDELIDYCETPTSESFAYKLKVLLERFIVSDPPRSKLLQLLPDKALAVFDEIERMLDDDHQRHMEMMNQQGY